MMGLSSLAVMANSLLLQFEGRPPPVQPPAAAKQRARASGSPAGKAEAQPLASGGSDGQVSPA
jgi:hypothetical protein